MNQDDRPHSIELEPEPEPVSIVVSLNDLDPNLKEPLSERSGIDLLDLKLVNLPAHMVFNIQPSVLDWISNQTIQRLEIDGYTVDCQSFCTNCVIKCQKEFLNSLILKRTGVNDSFIETSHAA